MGGRERPVPGKLGLWQPPARPGDAGADRSPDGDRQELDGPRPDQIRSAFGVGLLGRNSTKSNAIPDGSVRQLTIAMAIVSAFIIPSPSGPISSHFRKAAAASSALAAAPKFVSAVPGLKQVTPILSSFTSLRSSKVKRSAAILVA